MSARLLGAALVVATGIAGVGAMTAAGCSCRTRPEAGVQAERPAPAPARPTFTLFALAEMRGQIGPCGCTSDPLGDLSRTAALVAAARRAGPVLVLDAGSLLYSAAPVPPVLDAQEELKADLLVATYQKELGVAAIGLGPADLAKGPGKIRPARQAVNVTDPAVPTEPPRVIEVGGARVGVFGVLAQDAVERLAVGEPVAAGQAAVRQLRAAGAQLVVGLVQARGRRDAARLVREIGGIDVAIAGLGQQAPEPDRVEGEAERIGDGWLVIPANRGQTISRLDVTLRPGPGLADAVGPAGARARAEVIARQLAELDAELARFATDATADRAFVAAKQREREALAARRDALLGRPLVVPATGSYFTFEQVRVAKGLACAPGVVEAIAAFDLAAGQANVAAAADRPVPPPAKGAPGYVGVEKCGDCHEDAVTFWKTTHHAGAWKTLVDRGKQFDLSCINCHVTGYDRPGGSTVAHNEPLRDVQCEVCHGPASIHVARGGEDQPRTVQVAPAADLCATQCHTKEHSDTFDLEPYLRDILGPGHGEARRKALGDGPTGLALRTAALAKAGKALGPGCRK